MKPLKRETDALAALLVAGAESPEQLANAVIAELDRLRGERQFWYGAYITYGVPGVVGPFSTKGQAERAVKKLATDKAWTVTGHTDEGVAHLMAKVDAPPAPPKLSADQERKQAKAFWRKVHEIREGESPGLILESIKVVKP